MALTSEVRDELIASDQGEVRIKRRTLYYDDGVLVGDIFTTVIVKSPVGPEEPAPPGIDPKLQEIIDLYP